MLDMNTFGSIPISDGMNTILSKILEKFAEYDFNSEDPTIYSKIDTELGLLTENQWDVVDYLSTSPDKKPTIMELAQHMGKKSISSIQKPRDQAKRKFIESIITIALLLQEPAYQWFLREIYE